MKEFVTKNVFTHYRTDKFEIEYNPMVVHEIAKFKCTDFERKKTIEQSITGCAVECLSVDQINEVFKSMIENLFRITLNELMSE